jgi:hypothetical protein
MCGFRDQINNGGIKIMPLMVVYDLFEAKKFNSPSANLYIPPQMMMKMATILAAVKTFCTPVAKFTL